MAEQEQDRSEQATPFKLDEARKRGFVGKSLDVNSFLVVAGIVAVLSIGGPGIVRRELGIERAIMSVAARIELDSSGLTTWLGAVVLQTLEAIAPLFAVAVLLGVLGNLLQTGPVFSFFPLKPDFDRINPATGAKRLFSLRMVFESVKGVVKLTLMGAVAYFVLVGFIPQLLALAQTDPHAYPASLLHLVADLGFKLVLAMLLIALADYGYSRWDYANNMMMSRRELKDEIKRREGDPRIKTRMKELQRELLKRSKSLSRVKDADVLITNPTHFSVALLYTRDEMSAPRVVAKGVGEMAEKMRELARRHRVPMFRNPPLARALFRNVDLEREIPEKHYAEVARILAWAYAAATGPGRKG